jgi:hypothetical protein
MRFVHPSHPGRCVRLAYCLNVHPARTLDELLRGLAEITAPLRERVAHGREFGVGMYLPAPLARELAREPAASARLKADLERSGFDAFTYNAFPHGGFGESGLKARVFEPAWWESARTEYTLDVAKVARALRGAEHDAQPISISTHTGAHVSALAPNSRRERIEQAARAWSAVCRQFARDAQAGRGRLLLALEPEPDALLGSLAELTGAESAAAFAPHASEFAPHLGVCLDACHAAVMFEAPAESVERSTHFAAGVAKVQFTSALSLREPARNPRGRAALFALDEPRFLHQLAAHAPSGAVRLAGDLALARARFDAGDADFREADEWRCHFHVPVDLGELRELGLGVTHAHADELLERLLDAPDAWPDGELHLEAETYTWSILPRAARGPGELVDGLEREYRHVMARLAHRGWLPG